MSSNQDKILSWYREGKEDSRHQISKSAGMEFHYTKKYMSEYVKPASRIIELGCGTGYYGMFFADRCADYTGVDMSPENISIFKSNILAANKHNVSAIVGDATSLTEIDDDSFDIVMCFGPMYHLPQEERQSVFRECRRIACEGAVIAFAYINRLGVYAGGCVLDSQYPSAEVNKLVFEQNTGDGEPGVFFLTSPEEMENDAQKAGLSMIKNCGLDFMFASSAIDAMSEDQFDLYFELADRMSDSPSCTGLSNHALLICRK